jgi:hypothetical protein
MRITVALIAALSFNMALIAEESFYGTWKLNVTKSKLQCSDVASETMKIVETGPNSYRNITDVVSKSGEAHHQESGNRHPDGKDYPIPGKAGISQTIVRVDGSTHKIINKKDGKVVEGDYSSCLTGRQSTNQSSSGRSLRGDHGFREAMNLSRLTSRATIGT